MSFPRDHIDRMTSELDSSSRVVVVGASAAGLSAVESLRRLRFSGAITVIGAEDELPYDRPPLSKKIIKGEWETERVMLRSTDELKALSVTWNLGVAAASLDRNRKVLELVDGRTFPYDAVVLATGLSAKRLPFGHDLVGVHVFRTLADATAIRTHLQTASRVVIIGGGFLGLEVAAVARQLGLSVTVVDPLHAPLERQLGVSVAARCMVMHQDQGVEMLFSRSIRSFTSDQGRVAGVEMDDGTILTCDLVLVSIGAEPQTSWLVDSGLDIDNGIVCDQYCMAAPGVAAAGDVASWMHPIYGRMRVEHRLNATEQGAAAASALMGQRIPYGPPQYFWTDQYETKIQAYGMTSGELDISLIAGDIGTDRFSIAYGDGKKVVGALAWNMAKLGNNLRSMVLSGLSWSEVSS